MKEFQKRPDQRGLPEHGLITRFATFASLNPRYLSHINNGRKNIGVSLARKIELAFSKPHGWFDKLHESDDSAESSEDEQFMLTLFYRACKVDAEATQHALWSVITQKRTVDPIEIKKLKLIDSYQ
jgi:hypothetical protein